MRYHIGPNPPGQSRLPRRTADNFNGNLTAATSISSTSPVSQYKYGGKEWNPTSQSYDFGARNYMPAVPRWNSMDPLIKTLKPWGDEETVLIPYSYHSDEQTVEEYGVITVRYDDSL